MGCLPLSSNLFESRSDAFNVELSACASGTAASMAELMHSIKLCPEDDSCIVLDCKHCFVGAWTTDELSLITCIVQYTDTNL